MDKKMFNELIENENEYRKNSLTSVYNLFPEADGFIEWLIQSKSIFGSEIEAVSKFINAHTENREMKLVDSLIEYSNIKYDYHIKIVNDRLVADKFHGQVTDNSTAHMASVETSNPTDLINFLSLE